MAHDSALFAQRQQAITDSLKKNSLVAVFQASTQDGKFSLRDDGVNKVSAMYEGGVRTFEFLLRGDETLALDTHSALGLEQGITDPAKTYVGQVLATISELKKMYPDAVFGVGTISSPEVMQKVVANRDIDFVMTAHWPGMEENGIIDLAVQNNLPILPTASKLTDVPRKKTSTGELITFSKEDKGKDELVPVDMTQLRAKGVTLVKASDFTEIALKRAGDQETADDLRGSPSMDWKNKADKDALTKVAFGLIAVAEALRASFPNGEVPADQTFTVATTGGVDDKSLPYIGGSTKNTALLMKIREILGGEKSQEIKNILDRTTLGSGGTFMTKKHYDDIIAKGGTVEQAKEALTKIAKKGTEIALAAVSGSMLPEIAKAS